MKHPPERRRPDQSLSTESGLEDELASGRQFQCQSLNTGEDKPQDEKLAALQTECLREIDRLYGNVAHFLNSRQPAMGDKTGRELLKISPSELLRRLRLVEVSP